MSDRRTFILNITWGDGAMPGLPGVIGPFPTREEADGYALLNVPNGSWEVWPVAAPYSLTGHHDVHQCTDSVGWMS